MRTCWPTSGWPTPWPTGGQCLYLHGPVLLATSANVRAPATSSRDFDFGVLASCGPVGRPGAHSARLSVAYPLRRRLLPLVGNQSLNKAVRLGGLRGRRQDGLLVVLQDLDPVGQIIGVIL